MQFRKYWPVIPMALVLLASSGVTPASASPQFSITEVGVPLSAVNTRGGAMGHLPDGTPVVYAPTFGEPALLNVVNGETGALIGSHPLGDKTTAIYGGVSPDGSAYVAGQTPGANLFRYDPITASVTDLGAPVTGETNISRLSTFAPDGTLYSGTFPSGHVFSFHPDRGFTDFGPIADGEQYARSTAFDGEHTLYVGTGTNARLFAIDTQTRSKTEIPLPSEFAGTQSYINEMYYRDGLIFAFVTPAYAYLVFDTRTGTWREPLREAQATPITDAVEGKVYLVRRDVPDLFSYELTTGTLTQLTSRGQFAINSNRVLGLLQLRDPGWPGWTVAGFGLTGRMWHYNLETGQFRWVWSEAAGGGLKIAALGVGPDEKLYTAGYLTPGTMARVDKDSLAMEQLKGPSQAEFIGSVPLVNGETSLYVGSYLDAGIWRHDASKAWDFPTNPERIAHLDTHAQERILTVANASTRLAVGSLGRKGALGGALTIIDPRDNAITWTGEPVPDHAVASLLYQRVGPQAVLIGGTATHQLGVEHPDPEARLFVFDLQSLSTVQATIARPGVTSISAITQLPDGRIWAVANDSTILEVHVQRAADGQFSIETEEVVKIFGEPRHAGNWAGAKLAVLDDRHLVGNAAGWVYTIDLQSKTVAKIAEGSDATPTGDGRFFFSRNTKLFRADPLPPAPATTATWSGANWISVTLTAADRGGGVAGIEYRVDNGEWASYSSPTTLKRSDRPTREYRASSPSGSMEDLRCLSLAPGGGTGTHVIAPDDAVCELP